MHNQNLNLMLREYESMLDLDCILQLKSRIENILNILASMLVKKILII